MSETQQTAQDLAFLRDVVRRSESDPPVSVATGFMWAAIVLAGCLLNDLIPQYCWIFWITVPLVGLFISGMLGKRAALDAGMRDAGERSRHAMHWSIVFWAGLPIVLLLFRHQIDGWTMGQLLMLLGGVMYFLGGVHLERNYLLPGGALIVSAAILSFRFPFIWTTCGVIVAATLIVSFSVGHRKVPNV